MDREKVIKEFADYVHYFKPYCIGDIEDHAMLKDVLELLKEQDAMNVDVFVQWCIDSHIMGDATVRGIKYWVGKYKEIKEGR